MRALVVYESMFGNTREVAEAIADGVSEHLQVVVREVSEAPSPVDEVVSLIVVGGPTHAFSMSRASTRASAQSQGATEGEREIGIREWLATLRRGPHAELVACFDTKVDKARRMPGSAAKAAGKAAKSHGYAPAGRETFYVADTPGPLLPGELDRAREWGRTLGLQMAARDAGHAVG